MEVEISLERILNLKFGLSLDWSFEQLTHIDKFSGHESGTFLEIFSKKKFLLSYDVTMDDNWNESRGINRWRVGAPRHDIKVNLVGYLFQIFEFKTDHIEKSG